MAISAVDQIGELLADVPARSAFAARRTASVDDLRIEVKGVGPLRFPVPKAQARQLCRISRPARYGRGEETLLDERVRDTWEVPKSRVRIDRRRWNRTLLPTLDGLRSDLDLPDGCTLKPEFHSMLVYAPGQFFVPHQDSAKVDEMVGTLVVTLPSPFKGGAFVIEHGGERIAYRASKHVSFVAFYADCRHEVKPVKEGYRIVLTYNLMVEGDDSTAVGVEPEAVDALKKLIRKHFETPAPTRRGGSDDSPPAEPISRLVYLLDHQYTESGLDWSRLKGGDAARVGALRAAAERADSEMALALAEVHETWDCWDEEWDDSRFARSRRWERDEDDEWYTDYTPPDDIPDRYTLVDLVDWGTTLNCWIAPGSMKPQPISTRVLDYELCSTTPSVRLEPFAAEYEGYMGNYGNTMDRWYRRAAVVLWPRDRAFAVRAEASPAWALGVIRGRIRGSKVSEARKLAESLLTLWNNATAREQRRGFFDLALGVTEGLDDPQLAARLLHPFRIEALTPRQAPAFAALVRRYGEEWGRSVLSGWAPHSYDSWRPHHGKDRRTWLKSLAHLCEALRSVDDESGTVSARLVLPDQWGWLMLRIEAARGQMQPSRRAEALRELAGPILAFLEAAAIAEADDARDEAVAFLCAPENERLLPCLVRVLERASESMPPRLQHAVGLDAVRRRCVDLLAMRLATPAREGDDWSIDPPEECGCDLCVTLAEFLSARDVRKLEWPIAKPKRRHVHGIIDAHELPVRHETRRSGRPYTLVLTKLETLFDRETAARRSWQADLDWLRATSD